MRLASLDMLRGLIMVLMALDHVSAFVVRRHGAEFWGGAWTRYDAVAPFLTRFVTHLCAPGFFFLMGAGMALLAESRLSTGWDEARVRGFLLRRGLLLVAINQFIENPAWALGLMSGDVNAMAPPPGEQMPGAAGQMPMLAFTVITGLGLALAAGSLLLRFGNGVWWIVSLACLGACALLTPPPEQAAAQYSLLLRMLFVPGQSGVAFVLYPLVPWLGLTGLGVLFGRWLERDPAPVFRWAPWTGLALCLAAVALRAAGGFGNLRPPRDGSWIEFFNFIKYPPALVFTLFMLGGNLLLLALFRRLGAGWLAVFGQTPLFYYIAHLYLYAALGALFFRSGANLPLAYAVWLAGLVPLYFACMRYRRFKQSKPIDSVWRFF